MNRALRVCSAVSLFACEAPSVSSAPDVAIPPPAADASVRKDSAIETVVVDVPPLDAGRVGEAASCSKTCSLDRRSVVDCQGTVRTCGPLEECEGATCVAACESGRFAQSNVGCEFFLLTPDVHPQEVGNCFAAWVINVWSSPVRLGLERDGSTLDVASSSRLVAGAGANVTHTPLPQGELPPGGIAAVFLSANPSSVQGCPIPPAVPLDTAVHGTGRGKAFRLASTGPVVAYDVYPYGGALTAISGATLLLPSRTWGKEHVAFSAYPASPTSSLFPWIAIVAKEDGTIVKTQPKVSVAGGDGVVAAKAGDTASYELSRGEVIQFSQREELTGTPFVANKPVSVWGGATCMNVPASGQFCDAAHQELAPFSALGHTMPAVPHRARFEGGAERVPWRMVGVVDGTRIDYAPAPPPGAPRTLGAFEVAEFSSDAPFVAQSQDAAHPFLMAGYMTSCSEVRPLLSRECRGDPEFVPVVPAEQFATEHIVYADPHFPESHLVVVRARGPQGFEEVSLDCIGPLGGFRSLGNYQYARVDLSVDDFSGVGRCTSGVHHLMSKAPFGVTVWGWGSAATGGKYRDRLSPGLYSQSASYGYAGGMRLLPLHHETLSLP